MNLKWRAPIATLVAISVSLIVLLGYLFSTGITGELTLLGAVREMFLQIALVLAAVALLIGVGNLVSVHLSKIRKGEGEGYSFVLLTAFTITLFVGLYDIALNLFLGEPNFQRMLWIFDYIQVPIETSLLAVLAVSLTYGIARLLGRRLNLISVVFVIVVFVVIVSTIPLVSTYLPFIADLKSLFIYLPAVGGARGILLGVALGVIATGLRVIIGSDKPYGGA